MKKIALLFCIVFVVANIAFAAVPLVIQDKQKSKKRVKRPSLDKKDSIYFKNLFDEGLVGERPAPSSGNPKSKANNQQGTKSNNEPENSTTSGDGFAWSQLISREALELEVKTLSNQLSQTVSSPGNLRVEAIGMCVRSPQTWR